jgi:hypothetical protein
MNGVVHGESCCSCSLMSIVSLILFIAFMYSYYALRAMKWHIPRYMQIGLTLLQISQMLIGCFISYKVFQFKQKGINCEVTNSHIYWSFIMYGIYCCLFVHFFFNSYLLKKPSSIRSVSSASFKDAIIGDRGQVSTNVNSNSTKEQKKIK